MDFFLLHLIYKNSVFEQCSLNICYFTQKCLPIKHILILSLSIPCHPQIFNSIESFKRVADMIEFTKRAYRTVSIKGTFYHHLCGEYRFYLVIRFWHFRIKTRFRIALLYLYESFQLFYTCVTYLPETSTKQCLIFNYIRYVIIYKAIYYYKAILKHRIIILLIKTKIYSLLIVKSMVTIFVSIKIFRKCKWMLFKIRFVPFFSPGNFCDFHPGWKQRDFVLSEGWLYFIFFLHPISFS